MWNRVLSNFYPVDIIVDNLCYPTVENAYQALKADRYLRNQFTNISPARAKSMGRRVKMVKDFNRDEVMKLLLLKKFTQPHLKDYLLSTGNEELVEENTWNDIYWGVCREVGENKLGKYIMELREDLKFELLTKEKLPFFIQEKDREKAYVSYGFIGLGKEGSSTHYYRQQFEKANRPVNENFIQDIVYMVSINGDCSYLEETYNLCIKALEADAVLVMDCDKYLEESSYNRGEKELKDKLRSYTITEGKHYCYIQNKIH